MRISSVVNSIKPSGIRRFFDLAEKDPDVISLGVGEPDFVTPEVILQAAQKSIDEDLPIIHQMMGCSYFGKRYQNTLRPNSV